MKTDVRYSKVFRKQYQKSGSKIQAAFESRKRLFLNNPAHSQLHNHSLMGGYRGMKSINISGDWRTLYTEQVFSDSRSVQKIITFQLLGTHSQLYK